MIDVLVPCLGRPESILRLHDNWAQTCPPESELVFLVSPHDVEVLEVVLAHGARCHITDWQAGSGDYARKMNYGYRLTDREWLFLGAQDITFTDGWWERAFEHADSSHVIATNDKANAQVMRGQFGTHCLVRRSYVDEQGASADGPGVLIHEGYDHNFVDRELCGLAQMRGVFAFARNAIVLHAHPLWKTAPWDDTYHKALAKFREDQRLFFSRSHLWDYAGLSSAEMNVARRETRSASR